ncbi:hypothetical protein DFJ73DRAFT_769292 [Zopfochytrium polystomum]|nr:hypothetical protein DFJ73DRAFT_769292 [Zopfochytrium polystomum]
MVAVGLARQEALVGEEDPEARNPGAAASLPGVEAPAAGSPARKQKRSPTDTDATATEATAAVVFNTRPSDRGEVQAWPSFAAPSSTSTHTLVVAATIALLALPVVEANAPANPTAVAAGGHKGRGPRRKVPGASQMMLGGLGRQVDAIQCAFGDAAAGVSAAEVEQAEEVRVEEVRAAERVMERCLSGRGCAGGVASATRRRRRRRSRLQRRRRRVLCWRQRSRRPPTRRRVRRERRLRKHDDEDC